MSSLEVVALGREMILMSLLVSAPLLGFGLLAGLIISIVQAVTQINELTLTFVPKIVTVALALAFFLPWILNLLVGYTTNLFNSFVALIG
jgi:flagellar biosynthetic protein FliQ